MPRKTAEQPEIFEDELDSLRDENADLKERLKDADRKIDKQSLQAEGLADVVNGLRGDMTASMFLIVSACVLGSRIVLSLYELEWMTKPANWLFYGVGTILMSRWVWQAWLESHWLMIPKCAILLNAVSAYFLIGGQTLVANLFGIFVLCATPGIEISLALLNTFLTHPVAITKELYEKTGKIERLH